MIDDDVVKMLALRAPKNADAKTWVGGDKQRYRITQLETSHLKAILRYLYERARARRDAFLALGRGTSVLSADEERVVAEEFPLTRLLETHPCWQALKVEAMKRGVLSIPTPSTRRALELVQ